MKISITKLKEIVSKFEMEINYLQSEIKDCNVSGISFCIPQTTDTYENLEVTNE